MKKRIVEKHVVSMIEDQDQGLQEFVLFPHIKEHHPLVLTTHQMRSILIHIPKKIHIEVSLNMNLQEVLATKGRLAMSELNNLMKERMMNSPNLNLDPIQNRLIHPIKIVNVE